MKKAVVLGLFLTLFFLSCDKTTNSLIYTEASNIVTHVYITEYGSSYHVYDCYLIKGSKTTSIDRKEAEAKGYTACRVCFY